MNSRKYRGTHMTHRAASGKRTHMTHHAARGLTTPVGWLVTPIDRPKSVRNRCAIEVFGGLFVLSFGYRIFCWYRGFCHRTGSDLLLFLFILLVCIAVRTCAHSTIFRILVFLYSELNMYIIQWFTKDKRYSFCHDYEVSKQVWMGWFVIIQKCDTVMFQIFYGIIINVFENAKIHISLVLAFNMQTPPNILYFALD